jgi:hypothetical protein
MRAMWQGIHNTKLCACCYLWLVLLGCLQSKLVSNLGWSANSMTCRAGFIAAGGLHGEVSSARNNCRQQQQDRGVTTGLRAHKQQQQQQGWQ